MSAEGMPWTGRKEVNNLRNNGGAGHNALRFAHTRELRRFNRLVRQRPFGKRLQQAGVGVKYRLSGSRKK